MSDQKPDFDERVRAKLAAKFPELIFRVSAKATIDVLPRGGREPVAQIGLTSLAQSVAKAPEKEEELVAEHIGRLPFSKLTESLRGTARPHADKIFPRLVPQKRIDALPAVQKPAQMDFHGDVRVVIVAEFPYGDLYLTKSDLDELKLAWPEAIARACQNLTAHMRRSSIRAAPGRDGKPAVVIVDGHKHAAAALLLPEFPTSFGGELGEEFLVAIPAFDQLIAFRKDSPELVTNMVATARRSYEMSEYAITTQLFHVDPENVTPFELEDPNKPKIWLPS